MVFFPVSFRIIIAIMPSIVRVQYALKMQCVTCLHDDMCKSAAALLCNLLRKGPLHIATMPAFQPSTLESTCFSAHMIAVSSIERLLPLPMLQFEQA